MMKRRLGSVVLALAVALGAACSNSSAGGPADAQLAAASVPDEPAFIEGTITAVNDGGGNTFSILVENGTGEVDRAVVYVLGNTRILRQTDGGVVKARRSDLVVGTRVRVWITGNIRESYPVQVDADTILIL